MNIVFQSTNLKDGNYDTVKKTLDINFNSGATYRYKDVPADLIRDLVIAPSQGKFYNKNIAKKFNEQKIA